MSGCLCRSEAVFHAWKGICFHLGFLYWTHGWKGGTLNSKTKPVSHTFQIRKAPAFVFCVTLCFLHLRMWSQLAWRLVWIFTLEKLGIFRRPFKGGERYGEREGEGEGRGGGKTRQEVLTPWWSFKEMAFEVVESGSVRTESQLVSHLLHTRQAV